MADFSKASVQAVIDGMHSLAAKLGQFETLYDYEPKSPPGTGLSLALWWDSITPVAPASGLSKVSARIAFMARAYKSYTAASDTESRTDPDMLSGVLAFMAAVSESFTLGGIAMEVDLLGAYGEPLSAKAGYVFLGGKHLRIADIAVPVIVTDVWTETA